MSFAEVFQLFLVVPITLVTWRYVFTAGLKRSWRPLLVASALGVTFMWWLAV